MIDQKETARLSSMLCSDNIDIVDEGLLELQTPEREGSLRLLSAGLRISDYNQPETGGALTPHWALESHVALQLMVATKSTCLDATKLAVRSAKHFRNLDLLRSFPRLEVLELTYCDQVEDFGPLSSLEHLTSLSITHASCLTHIDFVSPLDNLKTLSLDLCDQLEDVTALGSLSVTDLRLPHGLTAPAEALPLSLETFSGSASNIDALGARPKLRCLHLSDCEQLVSLEPLGAFSTIEELGLWGCKNLLSLAGLKPCLRLEELRLYQADSLTSLSGMECPSLKRFTLHEAMKLDDLQGLTALKQLESFDFQHGDALKKLPRNMSHLEALKHLALGRVFKLTSLAPLATLPALEHLSIGGGRRLKTVKPLAANTGLQHLTLKGCSMSTLHWIQQLPLLESLDLTDSRGVTSMEFLEHLEKLKDLRVNFESTDERVEEAKRYLPKDCSFSYGHRSETGYY